MAQRSFGNNQTNSFFLWNLVFGMTILVYAAGLFIPIMEPDAAVYAQVSMEMHDRGDYLSIYHKGNDWLDKPHFPFWMSALSYEVFGVNTFAYKLPAVFFILLAAFYTFKFGKKFYSALHGRIAVIILITAEHIIISNQDVRAEPFMTGLLIMALYHLVSLINDPSAIPSLNNVPRKGWGAMWLHALLGSLATACLIMTKGLFTIIPLASGIGLTLIYQKRWQQIFHFRWMIILVLTAIFLSPAIYGYYRQFDMHPEKIVFGVTGVSGVEFFLWTSQWGRFTNTGPIKGKGDISFFIHTLLWAFLPWAFAAFVSIFQRTKQLLKKSAIPETYSYFGFIVLFIIFSASSFQLSFYLNPLFPLLAILTASLFVHGSAKTLKVFSIIHLVLCCLLIIGLIALHLIFSSNLPHADTIAIVITGILIGIFLFSRRGIHLKKVVFATALIVVSVNYYLNREFYPELLKYQAESEAANYIKENKIPAAQVVFADEMQSIADVILQQPTKVIAVDSLDKNITGKYIFTTDEGRNNLDSMALPYQLIKEFHDFPVTRLNGKFINKKTRLSETKKKYLLKVQ